MAENILRQGKTLSCDFINCVTVQSTHIESSDMLEVPWFRRICLSCVRSLLDVTQQNSAVTFGKKAVLKEDQLVVLFVCLQELLASLTLGCCRHRSVVARRMMCFCAVLCSSTQSILLFLMWILKLMEIFVFLGRIRLFPTVSHSHKWTDLGEGLCESALFPAYNSELIILLTRLAL